MAISKLGTDVSVQSTLNTLTVDHTLVAGTDRKIVVVTFMRSLTGTATAGVTYGGVSMTLADSIIVTSLFGSRLELWYLDEADLPSDGSNTVDPSWGSWALPEFNIWAAEYENIKQGAPSQTDTKGEGSPSDATIENAVSALASTEWAISGVATGDTVGASFTHGQSQVEGVDLDGSRCLFSTAELQGGSSETSLTSICDTTPNDLLRIVAVWDTESSGPTVLVVQDSTHNHTAENVALVQANTLVVNDSSHNHTTENVVLTELGINLIVQDSSHNHTAESPALVQANILVSVDATHNHTAENVGLGVLLITQDSSHNHTAEGVGLIQVNILSAADTTHNQTVDNVSIVQDHVLSINSTSHTHTSENVVLVQKHTLVSDDTTHPHKVENVTFLVTLITNDTTHNHTAENIVLTPALIVNDTTHNHTTENVLLILSLIPQDTTHNHTTENVALVQANTLVSQDTTHNHTVNNLVLIPGNVIIVLEDSTHSHTAEGIVLFSTFITMVGKFNTGATITIKIYDLLDNSLLVDTTMNEVGTTGYFKYRHQDVIELDSEYVVVMSDGDFEQGGRVYLFAGGGVGDVNLLQNIPDIVDAMWNEGIAEHNEVSSFGNLLQTINPGLIKSLSTTIVTATSQKTVKSSSEEQENQK